MGQIDTLIENFKSLPEPENYYRGKGREIFSLPENILLFYRYGDLSHPMTALHSFTLFHYRHVLILNFGEPIRMLVDGNLLSLGTNCCILLLPYQHHCYVQHEQSELNLFNITFEMTENLALETVRNAVLQFEEWIYDYLGKILELFQNDETTELIFQTGALLARLTALETSVFCDYGRSPKVSGLVAAVCRLVHRNLGLDIGGLSHELRYSESYLRRSFRRTMGISLGRYVLEVRLSAAMRYLLTSDKSVSEIAELVGYASVYSLSRTFKEHLGMSPTEFRNARAEKTQRLFGRMEIPGRADENFTGPDSFLPVRRKEV